MEDLRRTKERLVSMCCSQDEERLEWAAARRDLLGQLQESQQDTIRAREELETFKGVHHATAMQQQTERSDSLKVSPALAAVQQVPY